RDATLRALEQAIRLGTEIPFAIETPLMWRSKAETWALTEQLGGAWLVELIIGETHTCYRGERGMRHDWGYGCDACPACELRARGFAAWQSAKSAAQAASRCTRRGDGAGRAPQRIIQTAFMSVAGWWVARP